MTRGLCAEDPQEGTSPSLLGRAANGDSWKMVMSEHSRMIRSMEEAMRSGGGVARAQDGGEDGPTSGL